MIRTSDTVTALYAALAKAQATMPSAAKDTSGQIGQQRTKYADLPSVREAARGPLTENDLAFVQFPTAAAPGAVRIITRIIHKSGEWIEDDEGFTVPAGTTAQAVGSALTYARRYSLLSALGIVADDDDDGHAATKAAAPRQTPARPRTASEPTEHAGDVTEPQIRKMAATFRELGITERMARLGVIIGIVGRTIETSNDLSKQEAGMVIDALETRLRERGAA